MAPVSNRFTIDSTGSTSSIGNRLVRQLQLEQAAQRAQPRGLVVDQLAVFLEDLVIARSGRRSWSLWTVSGLKR